MRRGPDHHSCPPVILAVDRAVTDDAAVGSSRDHLTLKLPPILKHSPRSLYPPNVPPSSATPFQRPPPPLACILSIPTPASIFEPWLARARSQRIVKDFLGQIAQNLDKDLAFSLLEATQEKQANRFEGCSGNHSAISWHTGGKKIHW